jgi:hypothetical protein
MKAQIKKPILLVGTELGGQFFRTYPIYPDYVTNYYISTTVTPKIGFFVSKKMMIGLQAGKSYFKSNFLSFPENDRFGFLARYYFKERWRFVPYVEYNHLWTNYGPNPNDKKNFLNTGREFRYQVVSPIIGTNLRIYKSLYLDIGYRFLFYHDKTLSQLKYNRLSPKLGIEYIFTKKNKS